MLAGLRDVELFTPFMSNAMAAAAPGGRPARDLPAEYFRLSASVSAGGLVGSEPCIRASCILIPKLAKNVVSMLTE